MTIRNSMKTIISTAAMAVTLISPTQASAVTLSNIWGKLLDARLYAAQGRNYANAANGAVRNSVVPVLNDVQGKVNQIPALVDNMPDIGYILGNSKNFVEDNVIRITNDLQAIVNDFNSFKGDNCNAGTECDALRQKLLGIYRGLNGIKDTLPGYDILPNPGINDPKEMALQRMPPMVLFGLNSLTGRMDGLDNIAEFATWVDTLRFYAIRPIEENSNYSLPDAECSTLESSIKTENTQFIQMKESMEKVELITGMMKEIMPKDIVINAWVGTSIPNPALPVSVYMNSISGDFKELLEKELDARKKQVKACRTQAYRNKVKAALGIQ